MCVNGKLHHTAKCDDCLGKVTGQQHICVVALHEDLHKIQIYNRIGPFGGAGKRNPCVPTANYSHQWSACSNMAAAV